MVISMKRGLASMKIFEKEISAGNVNPEKLQKIKDKDLKVTKL